MGEDGKGAAAAVVASFDPQKRYASPAVDRAALGGGGGGASDAAAAVDAGGSVRGSEPASDDPGAFRSWYTS